jgi:hypothetical protein
MRLGTWNCQPGLASNWDVIEELNVDLIAIQEARSDTRALVEQHDDWMCLCEKVSTIRDSRSFLGSRIALRKRSQPTIPSLVSSARRP